MKNNKFIAFVLSIILFLNVYTLSVTYAFAHDAVLNVEYDECVWKNEVNDGIQEAWYGIYIVDRCYHISDTVQTVKYRFVDNPYTGESWENVPDAEEIKNAYVDSMKKWCDVYFYSYDSSGLVTKNKIVNLIEVTDDSYHITIFPGTEDNDNAAETQAMQGYYQEYTESHMHFHKWEMGINIAHFSTYGPFDLDYVNFVRERSGAHEFGHVLGLYDLDKNNLCNPSSDNEQEPPSEGHHHELLMGYGLPMMSRVSDITYKDIAGVAITRGFHTDDDHKWLYCGQQSNGTHKLLCSICNGVKNVDSLAGYSYDTYNSCGGNHSLSSGNMMAVASYEDKDYYKCRYCRYVAPFSSIVEQDYIKTHYSATKHECTNQVAGLNYSCYENHYNYSYAKYNQGAHYAYCECGYCIGTMAHVVYVDISNIKYCIHCGERLTNSGTITPVPGWSMNSESSITYITDAGSYVDADGVIYLVDSDMELYLAGELDVYALADAANGLVTE